MMNHTLKFAVTVPARTFHGIESARKRMRRSRSSIVAEALEAWLGSHTMERRDRAYLAGYERIPEPEEPQLAAALLASWDAWDDEPTRAGRRRRTARRQ